MVHVLCWLHVDHQHGRLCTLRDGQHHARGEVRGEVDDDHVAVRRAQLLGGRGAFTRIADEADVDDLAVHLLQSLRDEPRRCLELIEESGELRPVGAQAPGHQADPDGPMAPTLKADRLTARIDHAGTPRHAGQACGTDHG